MIYKLNNQICKNKRSGFTQYHNDSRRVRSRFLTNGAGFTLIELVIYMGLFSILLVISLQLFSSIFDVRLESEATSSVDTDGKFIIQRFSYDVSRATDISVPAELGTNSASLTITVNDQDLVYSLNGDDLTLQNIEAVTTDQLNSSETTVSDLSFIKLDGNGKDVVQMTFTLTSSVAKNSGKVVETFQTSAGLR